MDKKLYLFIVMYLPPRASYERYKTFYSHSNAMRFYDEKGPKWGCELITEVYDSYKDRAINRKIWLHMDKSNELLELLTIGIK